MDLFVFKLSISRHHHRVKNYIGFQKIWQVVKDLDESET